MESYSVSPEAIDNAAGDIEVLKARVLSLRQATAKAAGLISSGDEWGLLWRFNLHDVCIDLIENFRSHLREMHDGIAGAATKLRDTAHGYRSADQVCAQMFTEVGETSSHRAEELRPLNPASRFYQEHRVLHGTISSLPFPLGQFGMGVLDTWRLIGNIQSDDKYNISTDIAHLSNDLIAGGLGSISAAAQLKSDPLGYSIVQGVFFLTHFSYFAKDAANTITGDPISTGQAAYSFDSVAKGCQSLAEDFTRTLKTRLGGGQWAGPAAEQAKKRLVEFRDGIADTARNAEYVAAMLQLASSLMTLAEGIVKLVISDFVNWAILSWITGQMFAAQTGGVSLATRMALIHKESIETSGKLIRIVNTVKMFILRLRELWVRTMKALANSRSGQKFLAEDGVGGKADKTIREDYLRFRGKHRRSFYPLAPRDTMTHLKKNTERSVGNRILTEYGLLRYSNDKHGNPHPGGKQRISPIRYPISFGANPREVANYAGIVTITAKTLLPFGRFVQYRLRAGEMESDEQISQKLALD